MCSKPFARRAPAWTAPLSASLAIGLLFAGLAPAVADEPAIAGLGPVGEIRQLHTGFAFTEGPAADRQGNVYFTDIPNQKIHRVGSDGRLSTFVDDSGHANGLMFNADGELLACQMDGRVVAYRPDGSDLRVLADEYEGNRFNAPNDLVIDRHGGIYFTDPLFRAPMPLPQGTMGVYYIRPDGTVDRVLEDQPVPNGVILSPDESTLYVVPTGPVEIMAYPVEAPGKLGEGRVFGHLERGAGVENAGGDGLTVDVEGNLYVTSQLGLQVFNAQGELLGIIELPEQPANVAFGGPDNKTLYVTARTSLYTVPMAVAGHVFAAGER